MSTVNEIPYYDYNNDATDDNDVDDNTQKSLDQRILSERKPSTMLNTMRKRRAANIINENYVTDAHNNGE